MIAGTGGGALDAAAQQSGPQRGTVIVTGAAGEMGQALLPRLAERCHSVIATDLRECPEAFRALPANVRWCRGDIRERAFIESLDANGDGPLAAIYHLAAVLSTAGERNPHLAEEVNALGTLHLLQLAADRAVPGGRTLFLFPSSIAVYGLPDEAAKRAHPRVREEEFLAPRTIYGVGKLAGEHLGTYYAAHLGQLDRTPRTSGVDFRSIRFPGILAADTLPSGGTSDYGPEMLHAAARGEAYRCFVRPEAQIPFMTMPDAVEALLGLAAAPASGLRRRVYNVSAFSPTAEALAEQVRRHFPSAAISFEPDARRDAIVASWPADIDDTAARRDWGWSPRHDLATAFAEYLVPAVLARYGAAQAAGVGAVGT